MRGFSRETQRNYLRDIGRLATFLGRSPDTSGRNAPSALNQRTKAFDAVAASHADRLSAMVLPKHRADASEGIIDHRRKLSDSLEENIF
jgi:hypothetical protein